MHKVTILYKNGLHNIKCTYIQFSSHSYFFVIVINISHFLCKLLLNTGQLAIYSTNFIIVSTPYSKISYIFVICITMHCMIFIPVCLFLYNQQFKYSNVNTLMEYSLFNLKNISSIKYPHYLEILKIIQIYDIHFI